MAATTAGTIKAFLEAQGLGISVYRDRAPEGTPRPYVTVSEAISVVPDDHGDFGQGETVRELAQVDVWQPWRNPDRSNAESYTLTPAVFRALHGATLTAAPTHVYGCRVTGSVRLIEDAENVVHDALTVELSRVL